MTNQEPTRTEERTGEERTPPQPFAEYLQELREERGWERPALARELKISESFIEKLEQGNWQGLGSLSHLRGTIRRYAHVFSVPYEELWDRLSRDAGGRQNGGRDTLPPNRFIVSRFQLSSARVVRVGTGLVVFLMIAAYVASRVVASASAPVVRFVAFPSVASSSPVLIRGTIGKNVRELFINGQSVGLANGAFQYELFAGPGLNVVVVRARSFWGREAQWEQPVVMTGS
jgi:cytoskeletal protein RodZ